VVREVLPEGDILKAPVAVALLLVCCSMAEGVAQTADGPDAVARAILWGTAMPLPAHTGDLPRDVQKRAEEYRTREQGFRTALTPSPNETADERAMFERRVGIERVVFCLFPRRDVARVAAVFASDVDISSGWDGSSDGPRREAAFVEQLLRDLPQPWLAPYLNLIAGHGKLCASQMEGSDTDAQRQAIAADGRARLARARDGGNPLIRVAAERLLTDGRCVDP
jgi:hypothetical protein